MDTSLPLTSLNTKDIEEDERFNLPGCRNLMIILLVSVLIVIILITISIK